MDDKKTVFNSTKGLLTEDKNSLEVRENGQDRIVRTTDREQTAKDLKESQKDQKPLHD